MNKNHLDNIGLLQSRAAEEMTAVSYLKLAICLQQLHRVEEAHTVLLRAFDLDTEKVPVLKRLAQVLNLLGRHDESVEFLERVIRRRPERIIDI